MVVYAAKHGETAQDGEGVDSPFAVALARDVREPHVEVRKLFDIVRDDVWNSTKHEQQPFIYGSPPGREDFYFVAGKEPRGLGNCRHCEERKRRSNPYLLFRAMDCFPALAMTGRGR